VFYSLFFGDHKHSNGIVTTCSCSCRCSECHCHFMNNSYPHIEPPVRWCPSKKKKAGEENHTHSFSYWHSSRQALSPPNPSSTPLVADPRQRFWRHHCLLAGVLCLRPAYAPPPPLGILVLKALPEKMPKGVNKKGRNHWDKVNSINIIQKKGHLQIKEVLEIYAFDS